ncbi:MAG: hypothetical protein HFH41_05325 [Lachnospiraceae bacterium]|nr:hypothetical protein [Lachnospiraceae bacterium]
MWKKYFMTCVCLGVTMAAGGCQSTELEQRSFPLAAGIDLREEGEQKNLVVSFDFPDLAQISEKGRTTETAMGLSLEGMDMYHVEKSYENNTNRLLDYNHMKAVILGEGLLKDKEQLRTLLLSWEQREESARNTSLFVGAGSAAEILSLTEETEGSMGNYLEEMLESQKDFKQNKIATVGSLMNQWHNQNELLLIPVLTEGGGRPLITGYEAMVNFEHRGIITVEEAMESFLCQNLLEKFTCETVKNQVVEITDLRVSKTITKEGDLPVVIVSVSGKGKQKTGQISSVSEQYQLEKKIEKQLQADLMETGEKFQQEYGMDLTNSYVALGGHNRELYQKYKNDPDAYNQEVQQIFQVDISLMNWE